ncbi:MAG: DUF4062 domain-containing protein [Candidatus Poribacteria bacterium]|nr:DUF4062 domain-containing protein [Candidatus Poribacteria bacterium]
MNDSYKILRIFIASPSDLKEERKVVREEIEEFNRSWASEFGYRLEPAGWEETVSGCGRPQQLINQGVDRCHLFIGMVWRRWGTPPDNDGNYSSGFEEEFDRMMKRREENDHLEVSLFFKKISDECKKNPDKQLKRVLEFREKMDEEKKIFYQEFEEIQDIARLARDKIRAFVKEVKVADSIDSNKAKERSPDLEQQNETKEERDSSSLMPESIIFLRDLVGRIGQEGSMESLNAPDIARFRLLANSVSKPGNHRLSLGVHDANILYLHHINGGLKLDKREIIFLTRLGLYHLKSENVPFWCWYSAMLASGPGALLASSMHGVDDNEKIGAIRVLGALELDWPTNKNLPREKVLTFWFSKDSSAKVKSAALGYLATIGTVEDYSVAEEEYGREDHQTSRKALECMIAILLRAGLEEVAQQLILESQFESLDTRILQAVLEGFDGMKTALLLTGLEHPNSQVRLHALNILFERNELSQDLAEQLCKDREISIRDLAIKVLLQLGKSLNQEEIKRILTPPKARVGRSLFKAVAPAVSDKQVEMLLACHERESLMRLSESELTEQVEDSLMYEEAAYFARAEKYFSQYAGELRRDVDDSFGAYWEERLRRTEITFRNHPAELEEMVKKDKELESFHRKELIRQGLDVLCRAGESEDLHRIREHLKEGHLEVSRLDVKYLTKHGKWMDIPLLTQATVPFEGIAETLATSMAREKIQTEIAEAVLNMSYGHNLSKLFSLDIPSDILVKIVDLCPESRFSEISDEVFLKLLDHELADFRKTASIKAVQTFSRERIKSILHAYATSDQSHYYNVIHWLDLGVSMSRNEAMKVAATASGGFSP